MAADRINRVEVELHCGDVAVARAASERVSRAWGERIAPVVERVCAERGGDVLHRVERLELDLGAIDADALEDQLVARIEDALRDALAKALARRGGRDAHVEAALEVVESVALTGHVPWWAAADAREVAVHFARAAGAAERELVELVRRVGRDPVAVERLARLSDGQALVRLVERARPEVRGIPRGADRHERRELIELLVEEIAVPQREAQVQAQAREAAVASERAAAIARELASARDAAIARGDARAREAANAREAVIASDDVTVARDSDGDADASDDARVREAVVARAEAAASAIARDVTRAAILDEKPARDAPRDRAAALLDATDATATATDAPARDATPALPDAPRDLAHAPDATAPTPRTAPLPRPPLATAAPTRPPTPPPAVLAARRAAFARIDELFVANAGLVILAPFLRHYFRRVGVVDDAHAFVDLPSRYRALALLGALVDGDPEPLELHLALPKVLCGLALDADYLPPPALSPEELAEGERMIAAVLAMAPDLSNSSVEGFRHSFLQREGKLATRDGAYHLVVQRKTYDVLVDRLPWALSVVRLPWMTDPLWVEW